MNKPSTLSRALVFGIALSSWIGRPIYADSATWSANPNSGLWTEITNWKPNTIPNGAADIATFGFSNVTSIFIPVTNIAGGPIEVNGLVFNEGASAYTITANVSLDPAILRITGTGIINNSGIMQNFVNATNGGYGAIMIFTNSATAGSLTTYTNERIAHLGFSATATAGYATFINKGSTNAIDGPAFMSFGNSATAGHSTITNTVLGTFGGGGTRGGVLQFFGSSTAGDSNITNDGTHDPTGVGGSIFFSGASTAGRAIITNHGGTGGGTIDGGYTTFLDASSASHATLIANGGSNGSAGGRIIFDDDSTGGTSRVEVFDNGLLDISGHNASGVTIGSLEGSGLAFLGANNLGVGTNHRSSIFSGTIQDGGPSGGTGGSLTKVGLGNLTLSGSNTYTGPTTVNAGKLFVDGTVTNAVTVNGGALGGSGNTGAVTVNSGGTLAPGRSAAILDVPVNGLSGGAGILHVAGDVVLNLGATYLVDLNGIAVGTSYDQVAVMGAVNLGGALLSVSLGFAPNIGDVFTIVDNDAADAIGGTFDGLAEGDEITAGGETFAISYQGGDGNDVTLTSAAHEPGFSGPIPEPTTWALLLIGTAFAAHSMRRRRKA